MAKRGEVAGHRQGLDKRVRGDPEEEEGEDAEDDPPDTDLENTYREASPFLTPLPRPPRVPYEDIRRHKWSDPEDPDQDEKSNNRDGEHEDAYEKCRHSPRQQGPHEVGGRFPQARLKDEPKREEPHLDAQENVRRLSESPHERVGALGGTFDNTGIRHEADSREGDAEY